MDIALIGIVNDGGTLPQNHMRIELPRGETANVTLRVLTSRGVPVSLAGIGAGTQALTFVLRKSSQDGTDVLRKSLAQMASLGQEYAAFTIAATDLQRFDPGLYVYEIWLASGTGMAVKTCVVPLSVLALLPSVT